jgi:hypothetical protein
MIKRRQFTYVFIKDVLAHQFRSEDQKLSAYRKVDTYYTPFHSMVYWNVIVVLTAVLRRQ